MLNQNGNQKAIIVVAVLVVVVILALFFITREQAGPAKQVEPVNGVNVELEEALGVFPITILDMPDQVVKGAELQIDWQINPAEPTVINHTAIHWDTMSHPGDFGFSTTPADAGYTELTTHFASGGFETPGDFNASFLAPEADNIYLRAHAIIDGQHYWTSERVVGLIDETLEGEDDGSESEETTESEPTNANIKITYTDDGFIPVAINVKQGDEVVFVNNSSRSFWPATASHPTHRVYPGSSISNCNGPSTVVMFDACQPLGPSQEYSFIFNQTGSWGYHDHLRASLSGTIIVK